MASRRCHMPFGLLLLLTLHRAAGSKWNSLATKPPMGWRSWNHFLNQVSQDKIAAQVEALTTRFGGKPSLLEVGYSRVGIDDGWQDCHRGVNGTFHNASGFPLINDKFPNMGAMNAEAHAKGVMMGWYDTPSS